MEKEYSYILKFNKDHAGCRTCAGWDKCKEWREELNGSLTPGGCTDLDHRYYMNAAQLEGLIEESEAGAHEWVRDNTLFICELKNSYHGCTCCSYRQPTLLFPVKTDCLKGIIIPFRGIKGEPQVFGTYVESSEVAAQLFICADGDDDCNPDCPALNPHEFFENNGCYDPINYHAPEKEDRSDNEFNEKREDLRVMAGEMAVDGLEYAVIKTFTLRDLDATDISDQAFRHMYPFLEGSSCYLKTETLTTSAESTAKELLRLGFIEEKVVDPIVRLGDYFEYKDNIFKATWCGKRQLTLTSMFETEQYLSGGRLEDAEKANCDKINYTCHLSEIVGKDRLSKFKPVKVTVTEVE